LRSRITSTTFVSNLVIEAEEYCQYHFKFYTRNSKGETLRDQLESAWRQTGVKPKELEDEPMLPDICKDVWIAFVRLQNSKAPSMEGFTPIAFSEVLAYCTLYDITFDEWELQLLHVFDNIAREHTIKQMEEHQRRSKSKTK
jgi:hypothetical protein